MDNWKKLAWQTLLRKTSENCEYEQVNRKNCKLCLEKFKYEQLRDVTKC